MPFRNPLALLGLSSLIPLIILYLIRPRPREVPFPSTQFLLEGEAQRSAVVSRLITDPLFWIQLLILSTLSFAAAGPYTTAPGVPTGHLVVVMDASASMEDSFIGALDIASRYMEGYDRISLVLSESIPVVSMREGTGAQANDVLKGIYPKAVSADLSGAMQMAGSLLGAEGGDILVVSDFISWTGEDPAATRKLLEATGAQVVFEKSAGGGDNLAIVGGWLVEAGDLLNYTCLIRNYGLGRTASLSLQAGSAGSVKEEAWIPGDGDYYVSFQAPPGTSTISLELDDAISWDNVAYIYNPAKRPRQILYLGEDGPALAALQSLPNAIVHLSGTYSSYDLVVITENATFDGTLNRYIQNGGNLVYLAGNSTESPEFLPVKIHALAPGPAKLWAKSPGFAEAIHFDEIGVFEYLECEARRGSVTMVDANGYPALSYWHLGRGLVVYNALDKGLTDFYLRPEYPIFWYEMMGWMTGIPDPGESNKRTGEILPLGGAIEVETPRGAITTATLLLDLVGVYRFQGRTIVANMYDPRESDLQGGITFAKGQFLEGEAREKLVEKEYASWLIGLAALLIAAELLIVRWRREI